MSRSVRAVLREVGTSRASQRVRRRALVLTAAAAIAVGAGRAQLSAFPYAGQSQVNTTTSGDQERAAVAALDGGGWAVAWLERDGVEVVRARAFARAGVPLSAEATLDVGTTLGPPAIARLDDGRAVVVWREVAPGGSAVHGRFLTAAGLPTGGELTLRPLGAGLLNPAVDVAAADGGGFVAVWTHGAAVFCRRFDAQGAALDAAQTADTLSGPVKDEPRLARLAGGRGHVIVWQSTLSADGDADSFSVQWRRLDASGALVGVERQANAFTSGDQVHPDVAATLDGGFAILWNSVPGVPRVPGGEPIGDGIDLRRFRQDGTAVAAEVTVSADPSPVARQPVLVSGPDGELLAAWTVDEAIQARRFSTLSAIGSEFRVDDFVAAFDPELPAVAIDAEGDLVVVWQTIDSPGGDLSGSSVQLRAFTSGRTAHWRFEEGSGALAFDGAGRYPDDAVLVGPGIQWSWGRPGQTALAFAGTGFESWADVSPSVDLDIADPGLTLTAWLYFETTPGELSDPFSSIYDSAQDNYVLYLDRDNAELRFKVTDADGTAERPGIPDALVPRQRWFHVAGVYRGDLHAAEIYLDGELVDAHVNAALGGPVRSTPAQIVALGRDGENDRYYFDGRIEEIEVWRRGLSQEEVRMVRGGYLFGDGFERGSTLGWSGIVP